MRNFTITFSTLILMTSALCQGNRPPRDYVPDSATAVRIAEAVLIPVYGQKQVENEKPFTATLDKDVWTVDGTVQCSDGHGGTTTTMCVGGAAEVKISKIDARIISMMHYK